MPSSKFIDSGSGAILIETDTDNATAVPAGPAFSKTIKKLSEQIASSLESIGEEARPTEMSVSFDLKVSSSGQFMIASGAGTGNFRIEMKFGGGAQGGFPGIPQRI